MKTPLAMKYSGKYVPAGIEALNKGKTKSSDMPPKMKAKPQGGDYYKKPGAMGLRGSHKDMSSGQSMPYKGGDDNKKRYDGLAQSESFSMEGGNRPTKFVC